MSKQEGFTQELEDEAVRLALRSGRMRRELAENLGVGLSTLKSELVWRTTFFTRADAERDIARYIDGFYNPVRCHSALDYLSPAQFEKQAVS